MGKVRRKISLAKTGTLSHIFINIENCEEESTTVNTTRHNTVNNEKDEEESTITHNHDTIDNEEGEDESTTFYLK